MIYYWMLINKFNSNVSLFKVVNFNKKLLILGFEIAVTSKSISFDCIRNLGITNHQSSLKESMCLSGKGRKNYYHGFKVFYLTDIIIITGIRFSNY